MAFQSFWGGFLFMVTCIVIAIIMFFAGGSVIDRVFERAVNASVLEPDATANDFQKGSEGTMYFMINLYYAICYGLCGFGVAVFIQSILKKERPGEYVYR